MSIERSDKLFEAARDAKIKFDYFMLGVIGALCAFIGQSFHPGKLGWNPSTCELTALLALVAAGVAGFRCIETTNHLIQTNGQYLRLQEERGMLTSVVGGGAINKATGEAYSSAGVAKRILELNELIPEVRKVVDRIGNATLRAYTARNGLLLTAFLVLLASRVWGAYVADPSAIGLPSPVATVTAPQ